MKNLIILITICIISNLVKAQQWNLVLGSARDIAVGANGAVWSIGNTPTDGSFNIQSWNGSAWQNIDGGGVKIAVDPNGNPWIINSANQIWQRTPNGWISNPGLARDIAIGANGTVWSIGITPTDGSYNIQFWNGKIWQNVDGGGVSIAVDLNGNPWVINNDGQIFERVGGVGGGWQPRPGKAKDISVGANGAVWIIGTMAREGSFNVQSWNTTTGNWDEIDGGGTAIAVGPNGLPLIVNNNNEIYWRVFPVQLEVPASALIPLRVTGIVDMHTHPMSHLAFGGKVMHGAPDEQTLMLAGSVYSGTNVFGNWLHCQGEIKPGSINVALSRCDPIHGDWEPENNCGDIIRSSIVGKMDKIYNYFGVKNDGYPNFHVWPHQTTVTHQQMWHQWIRRAYDGGLRVMVSLAVHNRLLTKIANGENFTDDKSSADLQIREMISFVDRHNDFMEIAFNPEDLIRINNANKLAIILGIEVDDLGNFTYDRAYRNVALSRNNVRTELQRLYALGVRYLFPIHMSNNAFGGTAVNSGEFALISKFYTNNYIQVDNTSNEGLGYILKNFIPGVLDGNALRTRDLGYIIDNQPTYTLPTEGSGHANGLGLTNDGINALIEMMKMGFIIDIDHMSRKSMKAAIAVSALMRKYPLNAGHNRISEAGGNERNLSNEIVDSIYKTGGIIGIGSTDALPSDFANNFMNVFNRMGSKNVAIGTDANGMEPLPRSTPGLISEDFYRDFPLPKSQTGNRTWDYTNLKTQTIASTKGGVAHYGLMPEFFKDVSMQTNGTVINTALNRSADDFLIMWEKCVRTSLLLR